jgi:hypothetical protein
MDECIVAEMVAGDGLSTETSDTTASSAKRSGCSMMTTITNYFDMLSGIMLQEGVNLSIALPAQEGHNNPPARSSSEMFALTFES